MNRIDIPLTLREKLECHRRIITLLLGFIFVLTIALSASVVNVYRFKRLFENEIIDHSACLATLGQCKKCKR